MFRIIKKIWLYHRRLGFVRVTKVLTLIFLAKLVARRFTSLSTNWRILKLTLPEVKQPVYIRPGTTDVEVLQQVLLDHEYDFDLPVRPKLIVDAGANIGLASVYFANIYPEANIIALEPDRSNFRMLEMNTAAYPQIKPMNVALWSENKKINLFHPKGGHCGFRTSEDNSNVFEKWDEVPAVTLDALMKTLGIANIDVLKMDIEGAEREVFKNSSAWINQVGTFMVELHENYQAGCEEAFYQAAPHAQRMAVLKGETIFLANRTLN